MKVFELKYKICFLKDISKEDVLIRVASCIDRTLLKDEKWKCYHIENKLKEYSFCAPFPMPKDSTYKKYEVYQIIIRTLNIKLVEYLVENLPRYEDVYMKGIICEVKIIPKKHISKIYSLTPLIIKGSENGYWRDNMSFDEFGEQIKINLVKKYKLFVEKDFEEDFLFFSLIELKNKVPIKIKYKKIHLLGDKVDIQISDHPNAQLLAYMAQATGLGTMNQRGYGFINVKSD